MPPNSSHQQVVMRLQESALVEEKVLVCSWLLTEKTAKTFMPYEFPI